jgi:hypothetical protein
MLFWHYNALRQKEEVSVQANLDRQKIHGLRKAKGQC